MDVLDANPLIYFDHAATTSPDKEVVLLYNDILTNHFANPSSAHRLGIENARLLDQARKDILSFFKMNNHEVIFTSGATEANNLALKGYMERYKAKGKHLIVSSVEHPSILNVANHLEKSGFEVTYLKVDEYGKINLEELKSSIKEDTILVSIMAVNNETGIAQDINAVASILKNYPKISFHVDAVQAVGKIILPYNDIDLLTVSIHKLGGLKGTGLLIKRKSLELSPILDGGGQEKGFRSGTNDLAAAMSDALVIKKALSNVNKNKEYIAFITKPLYEYFDAHNELVLNSNKENPYIINISLLNKKASVLAEFLSNSNIMVSTHSACSSKLDIGSPTLLAMGKSTQLAKNSIRLSFALSNTLEEVNTFINIFDQGLKRIRG